MKVEGCSDVAKSVGKGEGDRSPASKPWLSKFFLRFLTRGNSPGECWSFSKLIFEFEDFLFSLFFQFVSPPGECASNDPSVSLEIRWKTLERRFDVSNLLLVWLVFFLDKRIRKPDYKETSTVRFSRSPCSSNPLGLTDPYFRCIVWPRLSLSLSLEVGRNLPSRRTRGDVNRKPARITKFRLTNSPCSTNFV